MDMSRNWERWCDLYWKKHSNMSALLPRIMSKIPTNSVVKDDDDDSFGDMGFLDDFINGLDSKKQEKFFKQIFHDLSCSVFGFSALADFHKPLKIFCYLVNDPRGAKNLVTHPWWIPNCVNLRGLDFEVTTILGPFLQITPLPDQTDDLIHVRLPNVGQACFPLTSNNETDEMSFTKIKSNMTRLYTGLTHIFKRLLGNKCTRECALDYVAQLINTNSSKACIMADPWSCASTGMLANLAVVMLGVFDPYSLENLPRHQELIDATYVFNNTRLSFRGLTTLHDASQVEIPEKSDYSFKCECFFMTARALHLGLVKAIMEHKELVHGILTCKTEDKVEILMQKNSCYEALLLNNGSFPEDALSFYRVMVNWLVDLVGGLKSPLPDACPKEFAAIPEHFVDDVVEVLIFVTRSTTFSVMANDMMQDYMNFIITFMASPNYIRNPYLRAKMVEVFYLWIQQRPLVTFLKPHLLQGYEESHTLRFLVSNLVKVFIQMEGTENQLDIRYKIAYQLTHLWQCPFYRDEWIKIAREEEKGTYLKFLDLLINDTYSLIDESFGSILWLKELEETHQLPNFVPEWEDIIRSKMALVHQYFDMLACTSVYITSPLLLPEMVERVANMLTYFLAKLIGPKTNIYSVRDPERYELSPQILLRRLVNIYVNLRQGDKHDAFPSAIAESPSYNEELFSRVANVFEKISCDGRVKVLFVVLQHHVRDAAKEIVEKENELGDIPDEFKDPIHCSLMKDPVRLPGSKQCMDRAVIERHLLSSQTDPFTRSYLDVNMLIPDVELKDKISEFIRAQKLKKHGI